MRRDELQRSLNRVVLAVGVLAAFACAAVSSGGWSEAALAGFFVLLLVLAAGGFAAGFAVRALAPLSGER